MLDDGATILDIIKVPSQEVNLLEWKLKMQRVILLLKWSVKKFS
jgi:hypothetical protein